MKYEVRFTVEVEDVPTMEGLLTDYYKCTQTLHTLLYERFLEMVQGSKYKQADAVVILDEIEHDKEVKK